VQHGTGPFACAMHLAVAQSRIIERARWNCNDIYETRAFVFRDFDTAEVSEVLGIIIVRHK